MPGLQSIMKCQRLSSYLKHEKKMEEIEVAFIVGSMRLLHKPGAVSIEKVLAPQPRKRGQEGVTPLAYSPFFLARNGSKPPNVCRRKECDLYYCPPSKQ